MEDSKDTSRSPGQNEQAMINEFRSQIPRFRTTNYIIIVVLGVSLSLGWHTQCHPGTNKQQDCPSRSTVIQGDPPEDPMMIKSFITRSTS